MTDQATINTMKGKPPAGELHGVFLCMNDYNKNENSNKP